MSHWRRTSVWWTLGLGLVMVVVLGLGGPPQAAVQNPCEEFSGVCHGQCQAALDQGCFENPDTRRCGKREEQWEDLACLGTPPWAPTEKRVFVTRTFYSGNLGGLVGADAQCQERADAAGLSGTFKAWLSAAGTGNSAAERLTHVTVPYVRVDGVQVAANFTDLADGTLAAPISIDEFCNPITLFQAAWTGTNHDDTSAPANCNGWFTASGAVEGQAGTLLSATGWTDLFDFPCDFSEHIYCFEQ